MFGILLGPSSCRVTDIHEGLDCELPRARLVTREPDRPGAQRRGAQGRVGRVRTGEEGHTPQLRSVRA